MSSTETITLSLSPTAPSALGPIVVPRELGTVHLDREIGRGGMGAVWRGRDRLLGRDVAVKFLLHAVADEADPHFVRFLEGARLAAAVKHTSLTTLYHADLAGGVPYLVMEYVDGPSLHQLVHRTGALSLSESLAVLHAVCEAVGELHDREIVHRDIKPANVLLDPDGKIYVTDFGLVCPRVTLANSGDRCQAIAGTPAYMAPEMFDGTVTQRSDVYALGVMTYELLVGRSPFVGTLERLVVLHHHAPLPTLYVSNGGENIALEEVLQRATHKDATYRHKTARHFLRALREAIRDPGAWSQGPRFLASRIARFGRDSRAQHVSEPATPSSSSYFQRLTELASQKHASPSQNKLEPANTLGMSFIDAASIPNAVRVDLPCVHCGYNLRDLIRTDHCPECGRPIVDSLREDRLMFADRKWLSRVVQGQRLLLIAMIGFLVLIIPWLLMGLLVPSFVNSFLGHFTSGIQFYGIMACFLVVLLGSWLSTTSEPIRGIAFADPWIRRITRFAGACALVMVSLVIIGRTTGARTAFFSHFGIHDIGSYARDRLLLFTYACLSGHVYYSAWLANRAPELKIASPARMVAGLMIALFFWMAVTFLLMNYAALMPSKWPILLENCFFVIGVISVLALPVGLGLCDRLRRFAKRILDP